jgi:hypothetical protein
VHSANSEYASTTYQVEQAMRFLGARAASSAGSIFAFANPLGSTTWCANRTAYYESVDVVL